MLTKSRMAVSWITSAYLLSLPSFRCGPHFSLCFIYIPFLSITSFRVLTYHSSLDLTVNFSCMIFVCPASTVPSILSLPSSLDRMHC
ncbi:hypothetical protein BKA70DRAFT_1329216 [Coprinopsis sp. MPI-PUGE-AT-0042]|nr:hypothetical protein BKA70DRAFT_1329216 [Coprinopsis sp. MPI-PUGE-AT-0042]